jgi:26 proteasome complex subunit DSS1
MSSSASSSKPADKQPEKLKEEDSQPHLGVLEEDDEFEEFEVAGDHSVVAYVIDVC